MQYGLEVETYKRIGKRKKENKETMYYSPVKLAVIFSVGLLVSRVLINLNISKVDYIAPFGVAYLLSFLGERDRVYKIAASIGTLVGYLTIISKVNDGNMYIITTCILTVASVIPLKIDKKINNIKNIIFLYGLILIYKCVLQGYEVLFSIILSFSLTMVMASVSYIIKYSLECIEEFNTEHLFSKEEIISVIILIALTITGIGQLTLLNVSLRNVIGLLMVILIAYISEGTLGATTGIALGAIIGITTGDMPFYVCLYGVCGLTVGIFKDMGKIFSMAAFLIIYMILNMYSQDFTLYNGIEGALSVALFIIIPRKIFNKLSLEFDSEKKEDKNAQVHFMKIKEEFGKRLKDFTQLLENMSTTLQSFDDNDRLLLKNTSSALIENLGDRVCSNCDMKYMCWKRELYSTYVSFSELIKSAEEGKIKFPADLEKKCVRKNRLIKSTEEIVENHVLNSMWKKRLAEGRRMLAGHIGNMANTVEDILVNLDKDIELSSELERNVKKMLRKNNIKFYDVFCYEDKNCRVNIKLTMDNCKGSKTCIKDVIPLINDIIGKPMSVGGEGCHINPSNNQCTVLIEEMPKYYVQSHVALSCKEGEKYTGDSYSFGNTKDGGYMTIISDGMGSGPSAGTESKATVELIEKFTSAGFKNTTAINAVNSIMNMKFAEDEKFATLDMNTIDLYTGEVEFIKIGAVASFIKSNNKVEEINSKTLPFGVLDKPDIEMVNRKLKNGDILLTLSDGILEINKNETGNTGWIVNYLRETKITNPKEMAQDIMQKAKELSGGKCKDDMTIVASKIYACY
ncbi:stage II sporulation protein E [Clostridium sp. 'White wine YQ']|uniref:stage II sporulation protein E n=1 Tax=Clostridium sp. 'White wine YQ' TaxID=3027474 RepID=UPI00236555A9|nr:stage II sporulation protein E [Clostridium sp. 'White wine YQ']MDD7795047.1 stage II sporulation protein E [Clostridium sp. 'White wine YQ']